MLEIIDSGVAQINKREKALRLHKPYIPNSPTGQDAWVCDGGRGVFAVADGVAQSLNADMAARETCREFLRRVTENGPLHTGQQAVDMVTQHQLLDKLHQTALDTHAMTTFTGAIVTPDSMLTYMHVGDSRLFLRRDDQLQTLTSEQVVGGIAMSMLFNYLGYSNVHDTARTVALAPPNTPAPHMVAQAEWGTQQLQHNDRVILVTDGITGDHDRDRMSDADILRQTKLNIGAAAAAYALVDRSTKIDDSTAVVFDIGVGKNQSINP